MTVYPPFKNLPSFVVSANVLSFVLFKEEVKQFLLLLNKNAGLYYEKHIEVLSDFLVNDNRKLHMLEFGQKICPYKKGFPMMFELDQMRLRSKKASVCRINFKCLNNNDKLTAIQIVFANGIETPLFEHRRHKGKAGQELRTIDVDSTRWIKQVSVKVCLGCITSFCGLRLVDEHGSFIIDTIWRTISDGGIWIT